MPAMNASAVPSIVSEMNEGGDWPGNANRSSRTPHHAIITPSAPATAANARLSVINWRTSLPRDAPSAVRTAISLERAAPRASSKLATFAHTMSSTITTAARNT